MADDLFRTVRIPGRSKVQTDDRGRSVWMDPVDTADLELVSTQMLKQVLDSDDEARKRQIEEAAEGGDGLLALDTRNDRFAIIDDAELQAILDSVPQGMDALKTADVVYEPLSDITDIDDEELSLVSTQALRRMLKIEDDVSDSEDPPDETGFDPYNSG